MEFSIRGASPRSRRVVRYIGAGNVGNFAPWADGVAATYTGLSRTVREWRGKDRLQRRRADGSWRTVGTDQTSDFGGYRERIPDRVGLYRAVAVRESLNAGADICARDRSPTVRHRH